MGREKEEYREEENGKGSTHFISIVYSQCYTCFWEHKPVLYCNENILSKRKPLSLSTNLVIALESTHHQDHKMLRVMNFESKFEK